MREEGKGEIAKHFFLHSDPDLNSTGTVVTYIREVSCALSAVPAGLF